VLVRSELKGQGLGRLLMGTLIHYLQERGTRWMVGLVLAENEGMLALARALGFVQSVDPEDPGVRLVRLDLQSTDTGTRLANAHINS
jgi:acetyltransferase